MKEEGRWGRVPVVLDNLILNGEMPVTVGILIDPGVVPGSAGEAPVRFNRSFEYDALGSSPSSGPTPASAAARPIRP